MDNGSVGSNVKSLIAECRSRTMRNDNSYIPATCVQRLTSDDEDDDDGDDDVLTSVLSQVHDAYVLPPTTYAHVSQFTKRLDYYEELTTNQMNSSTAPLGYRCQLPVKPVDETPRRVNVGDHQNSFESCLDKHLQQSFKHVPEIKDLTSSGIHADDVYYSGGQCRQNWFHHRSVSIPPCLRPIEEESDNELLSAGVRDVIVHRPIGERHRHDVIANGRCYFDNGRISDIIGTEDRSIDSQRPINERVCHDVIKCDQRIAEEGSTYCKSDVIHNTVLREISSRDFRRPINAAGSCRTADDVDGVESQSSDQWRLTYVIMASLALFVAFMTLLSPSCVIFVVAVTSLIAHRLIQL